MAMTTMTTLPMTQLDKCKADVLNAEEAYKVIQYLLTLAEIQFEKANKRRSDLEKMSHREKRLCQERVNDFYYLASSEYNFLKREMEAAEEALNLAIKLLKHEEFVQEWFNSKEN